jgi:ABC-type molybdate transport system substrate-binding protein
LPGDLDKVTAFAAGITANCKNVDTAKAFLKFLQAPEAQKVLEASGFDKK